MKEFSDIIKDIPTSLPDIEYCLNYEPTDTISETVQRDHDFYIARNKQEVSKRDEEIKQLQDIHKLRIRTVICLFILVALFLIYTCIIFILIGTDTLVYPPSVIIAFIVQTLATVLGLFCMALRWLFPRHPALPSTE